MHLTEGQATGVHVGAIVGAVLLLALGLGVFTTPGDATVRLVLLVVLVLLLALEVALFLQQRRAAGLGEAPDDLAYEDAWEAPAGGPKAAATAPAHAHEGAAHAPASGAAAAPGPASIAIRCKECREVFRVTDTGERPLVAACTHCGKQGTVKVRSHA